MDLLCNIERALSKAQARDTRKRCTCDGDGRGPGRPCVVKAGGQLGRLWRCAMGYSAMPPKHQERQR